MHDAAAAMLRLGSRNRDQITIFQVRSCAGLLLKLMTSPPRSMPTERAAGIAVDMALEQLDRAISGR